VKVAEVTTERLLLRGFREEDTDAWAEICADEEVMRSAGLEHGLTAPESYRDMLFWLGHWGLKGFGHWALEERATGELIGRTGLYHPPDWPGVEVGWTVARPRWGEGFAPEAGAASLRWAFGELGLEHVISLIADGNRRSQRVAEKLGMGLEGRVTVRGHELRMYGTDAAPAGRGPARSRVST
jgi:RimJ/RimL family protein N-acetyltransferase